MIEKSQIEAAARNLARRFGENAPSEADLRVMEMERLGQSEAVGFWRRVRETVRVAVDKYSPPIH
jgi:hypothetical protein